MRRVCVRTASIRGRIESLITPTVEASPQGQGGEGSAPTRQPPGDLPTKLEDPKDALHTAARRHCLGALLGRRPPPTWWPGPAPAPAAPPSPEGAALLDALLRVIEAAAPDDFAITAELHAFLTGAALLVKVEEPRYTWSRDAAGEREEVVIRRPAPTPTHEAERRRFLDVLAGLDDAALRRVLPLPYRRLLGGGERARIRAGLCVRWGVDDGAHCWHPLWSTATPADVLVASARAFDAAVGEVGLRRALAARGGARVWTLLERGWGDEYEQDLALCRFDAREGYYTAPGLDWLVYRSHEDTIAVAGDWLVDAVDRTWPGRAAHRW